MHFCRVQEITFKYSEDEARQLQEFGEILNGTDLQQIPWSFRVKNVNVPK